MTLLTTSGQNPFGAPPSSTNESPFPNPFESLESGTNPFMGFIQQFFQNLTSGLNERPPSFPEFIKRSPEASPEAAKESKSKTVVEKSDKRHNSTSTSRKTRSAYDFAISFLNDMADALNRYEEL